MSDKNKMKDYELHLLKLIPVGVNNAITTKVLEEKTKKMLEKLGVLFVD